MKNTKYYNIEADESFTIYFKEEPLLEKRPQFHDSIEFAIVKKGNIKAFLEGKEFNLNPGDIFFAESYETHSYDYEGQISVIILVLSRDYIANFRNLYPDLTFDTLMNDRNKNVFLFEIIEKWINTKEKTQLINYGFCNLFFGKIIELYGLKQRHQYDGNVFLKEILRYIHLHYLEDITLKKIASDLGFSVEYCSKILSSGLSCNFRKYINSLRIRKVKELMNDKSLNLTQLEIMYKCGFTSPATYYRALKQLKS